MKTKLLRKLKASDKWGKMKEVREYVKQGKEYCAREELELLLDARTTSVGRHIGDALRRSTLPVFAGGLGGYMISRGVQGISHFLPVDFNYSIYNVLPIGLSFLGTILAARYVIKNVDRLNSDSSLGRVSKFNNMLEKSRGEE